MVSRGDFRFALVKSRISDRCSFSFCPKIESKNFACCCQYGFLVSGVSGDSGAGGNPAMYRAVSSAVAASALLAGTAESISRPRTGTTNLMIDMRCFRSFQRICEEWGSDARFLANERDKK